MSSTLKSIALDAGKQALKAKLASSNSNSNSYNRSYASSSPQVPPRAGFPPRTAATYPLPPNSYDYDYKSSASGSLRSAGRAAATSHATSLGKAAGKKYIDAYIAVPRLVVRALQFVLGLVACGIYGHLVAKAASAEWVFAVFVAGASCVVAALFAASTPLSVVFSRLQTHKLFAVDLVLALLWIVVFGVFAGIFLKRTDEEGEYKGSRTGLMKAMVWFDLACAVLWVGSGAYGALRTFAGNQANKAGGKFIGQLFATKEPEVSKV